MILAAIIRQFASRPDGNVLLEKSFPLATTPSVGSQLRIAGEPVGPLRVVQVLVHVTPALHDLEGAPLVEVYTAPEPSALIGLARARGWCDRTATRPADDAA